MALKALHYRLLQSIVEEENILNPKINESPGSTCGDGFLGIHRVVKISGENKSLNLFVKTATDNEEFRKQEGIRTFFLNECAFYNKIYPTFLKFQLEKRCGCLFSSVPKCYKAAPIDPQETLILEDLNAIGYRSFDRKTTMDQNHIELVLTELSALHSLSFVFRDQSPEEFNKVSREIYSTYAFDDLMFHHNEDCQNMFKCLVNFAEDSLASLADVDLIVRFRRFSEEILPFMKQWKEMTDDEYSVIAHGDAWCNNFMFKYQDTKNPTKPTKMCFLDWQMVRKTSPVLDIAYFFYSTGSKEEIDNLEQFLNLYYNNLVRHIEALGGSPEKLYPHHIFRQHWRKYCRYGLIMSMLTIKMQLSQSDEVNSFQDIVKEKVNIYEMLTRDIKDDKLYKQRLQDIIVHFDKNGFLNLLNIA